MLFAAIAPAIQHIVDSRAYRLSSDTLKLVGTSDTSLSKKLTYDAKSQAYQFNKSAVPSDSENPFASMQAQVGKSTGKDSKSLYALDVSKDGSQGVRYYDTNSGLSFRLVPEYKIGAGKTVDGHLVYPLESDSQAVYTLKNNGLKEDIVLQRASEDTLTFRYKLDLPKTLEMRAIPNSGGAVGVYSADPSLFGDISYGSDSDRASVQKARENAEKSYLVFGLPSPVIKDTEGKSVGNARFELTGDTLTVIAGELSKLPMPVSIDPSVVVTSTTDFQYGGNDESNISFETSGQITRDSLTGGTVGSWASVASLPEIQYVMGYVTYNGYLYGLTGNGDIGASVSYTHIASDGSLDTWSTTSALSFERFYLGAAAYNGYMYVWGGYNSGLLVATNLVEYAKINSDGTLAAWQTTTAMNTAVCRAGYTSYAGYLYALGGITSPSSDCGSTSTGAISDVQYAPIKADGSVGTWSTTTSLAYGTSGAIMSPYADEYNGYMYVLSGTDAPITTVYNDVQYAVINSDGTLGNWMATTPVPTGSYRGAFTIYNGYMYIASDQSSSTTVRYAPINANGGVGVWRTSTSLTVAKWGAGLVGYNDKLYFAGGTGTQAVYSASVNTAGQPSSFTTTATSFTTARALACSVAYNGYIYVIGGSTNDSNNNNVTTVRYSALNATTGQTGTWAATTVLPVATGSAGCVAYNGYIYLVGGYTGTGTGTLSNVVRAIPINANGSLGTWSTESSTGLSALTAELFIYSAAGGTYLYALVVDGQSGGQNVMRATITTPTSGTISSWTGVDSSLPDLSSRAFAQVGNHLYAMGGQTAGTASAAVYYTSIASDGTVPTWQTTTSLNTAIGFSAGTAMNGCIYSIGGKDSGGTSLANVQYACPNADGTISTWYNAPNLSVATADLGATSYNGYIYGVGGWSTSARATTQFGFVDNGGSGSASAWGATTSFITARRGHATLAYNNHMYVLGGRTPSTYLGDVQYASLGDDGTLSAWHYTHNSTDDGTTFVAGFPTARDYFSAAVYNGYMYIAGGYNGSYQNDVQYAPINSDGTLGNWVTANTSTSFTTARDGHSMIAYKGYVYIIAGYDGSTAYNDVQYAPINSDGTLGTWAATTSFATARAFTSAQVYNGYMYIAGGSNGPAYNDVQYAPINSNGTVGSWAATTSFSGIRTEFGSAVYDGYFYIFGGTDGTAYYNDVQYAPINSNGTLGTWAWAGAGAAFTTTRSYIASAVYGGNIYVLGGYDGTSYYNDTQYSTLNVMPHIGHYSKLIDMGATVNIKSITYNGNLPNSIAPGLSPISYRPAASNGVFNSSMTYTNVPVGANACDTTSTSYTRYLLITVTLDDSSGGGTGGIFPDANGTNANLTDITVTYTPVHATPDIRLRAGKSLQQGSLTPLDTCYP
jgi:hypothetical protein